MVRPRISSKKIKEARELIASGKSIREAGRTLGVGATTIRHRLKNGDLPHPKNAKIRELNFKRIFSFQLIPRYLLEQVKDGDWDLDLLYQYGDLVAQHPLTLLYVLADKDYVIKGLLWGAIEPLSKTISIYVLSVDKEYQDRGGPILYAREFARNLKEKMGFKKTEFPTTKPRAFERLGFKRSKVVMMED